MKVGVLDFEAVECSPIKKIKGEKKVTSKVFGNWDIYGTNYSYAFQRLFSVLNELWWRLYKICEKRKTAIMMTFFNINVFLGGGYPKKRNNNMHKQGI